MDLVRACAELGLTPSASLREAKRAYRKLVKRWHPDRFVNDPQGQAEATLRLQRINEAYRAVEHALGPAAIVDSVLRPTPGGSGPDRAERLPREEVERLVRSLGNEGPLDAFFNRPMWWLPLAFGLMFLVPTRSAAYEWHFVGGIVLVAVAPVLWLIERRWRSR